MNDPLGRVEFARHFYDLLCVVSDREDEKDTNDAIQRLNTTVETHGMPSMYTKKSSNDGGTKRPRTRDSDAGGGRKVTTDGSEQVGMR